MKLESVPACEEAPCEEPVKEPEAVEPVGYEEYEAPSKICGLVRRYVRR